tara:strand:- start:617 stop:943 length:327 start_codon:yes stop_codon:yes gene_type:complete
MGYKEEQAILNQQTEVPCPGGGRDQRCKMGDIIGRSSLRTSKGEYKFKSSDQYKAKDAIKKLIQRQEKFDKEVENMQKQLIRDVEKLQDNFGKAFSNILVSADKISKG